MNQSLDDMINQQQKRNKDSNHFKAQHDQYNHFKPHHDHMRPQYQNKNRQHQKKVVDRKGGPDSILNRLRTRQQCQEDSESQSQQTKVNKVQKTAINKRLQIKKRKVEKEESDEEDDYDHELGGKRMQVSKLMQKKRMIEKELNQGGYQSDDPVLQRMIQISKMMQKKRILENKEVDDEDDYDHDRAAKRMMQLQELIIQKGFEEEEERKFDKEQRLKKQKEQRLMNQKEERLMNQKEERLFNKEFKTVYITHMANDIQVLEIKEVFAKFGRIININVQWSPDLPEFNHQLQFVKIQFESNQQAQKAQQETDGAMLNGHQLIAKLVKEI